MRIRIYKTNNCKNCELLLKNLKEAIKILNRSDIELLEESSLINISKKNIVNIPALEIDDKIISEGFVYSSEDLVDIINGKINNNLKNNMICNEEGCKINDK